jgi:hypothetical protein
MSRFNFSSDTKHIGSYSNASDVTASNLDKDTECPWWFRDFPQPLPINSGTVFQLGDGPFCPSSL